MRLAYDVAAIRAAEAAAMAGGPDGELMQRAATGLAALCARLLRDERAGGRGVAGARVVLLVGSGNNGGDALWAGARLAQRGARVVAVLLAERVHEQGLAALRAAGGRVVPAPGVSGAEDLRAVARRELASADLVLDGIIGIGGRGGLRQPAADLARAAAEGPGFLVAVDIPSGVDADTGVVEGAAVSADLTVTFGALKPGLCVDPGASHAGAVAVIDIGLEPHLSDAEPTLRVLDAADLADLLPQPARETDKYRRGVLGVRAGTDRYPGAAVLCTGAGARAGAGMVRYVGPDAAARHVLSAWPEVVVGAGRVQAWTVGSGLSGPDEVGDDVLAALREDASVPAVLDAGAVQLVTQLPHPARFLLTPHAGELARLLDVDRAEVEARRLEHASLAATRFGATVLLKGSTTVVATPGQPGWANPTGTPALATAGSGDVLAGVCGALLAQGLAPDEAGAVGAWVHGLAGRLVSTSDHGSHPIVAADVITALPRALAVPAVP
ncbi:MAG: NAD(P)H-hydrate dehydratase [Actinomycetales bacterium]